MNYKYYFAHQTSNRHEARQVELRIEAACPNLELDNPFYDGDAKEVKSLDATGKSDMSPYEITAVDMNKVREANGVVAFINKNELAIGTDFECFECIKLGKPLYVISELLWNKFDGKGHPFHRHFGVPLFKNSYAFIKFWNAKYPSEPAPKKRGRPRKSIWARLFPQNQ